eukprot:7825968-Lingulodinium_polyedra.AAC.1
MGRAGPPQPAGGLPGPWEPGLSGPADQRASPARPEAQRPTESGAAAVFSARAQMSSLGRRIAGVC